VISSSTSLPIVSAIAPDGIAECAGIVIELQESLTVDHKDNLAAIFACAITPITEDRMTGPVLGNGSFGRQRDLRIVRPGGAQTAILENAF
jgi:hypothetical protein